MALPRLINRTGPGEDGKPAMFEDISNTEAELRSLIYEKYSVDHYVAERISLHRRVGEHRNPICLKQRYNLTYLEEYQTTVIVGF